MVCEMRRIPMQIYEGARMKFRLYKWIKPVMGLVGVLTSYLILGIFWSGAYEAGERETDPALAADFEQLRERGISTADGHRVVVDVDYSLKGAWYPSIEANILKPLVEEGFLPGVEARVGPEPVVMKGVRGNGEYGGTWIRGVETERNISEIWTRISYANLVRWSATGEPIVPHIAKSWEHSEDMRVWTFHIRKGIRWSDGEPFTVDDILYWWKHEAKHPGVGFTAQSIMRHRGKWGDIRKIDDHTVEFSFEDPHRQFIKLMATRDGRDVAFSPEHYLKQYHPDVGDPEAIERASQEWDISNRLELYRAIKNWYNPNIPRMWPWIYREYQNSPPHAFVRNPYYFAVDTEGRQLPYLDRLLYQVKSSSMLEVAASQGELMAQHKGAEFRNYTLLMSQGDEYGYHVKHWSPGEGSSTLLHPNLNKRVEEGNHEETLKAELLKEPGFRQALSLAINRKAIIETQYFGIGEPLQVGPNPNSPYYLPKQRHAFTEYDPEQANALLDDLGLKRPEGNKYRKFPDGTPLIVTLNYTDGGQGMTALAQALVHDWGEVGVELVGYNYSRRRWIRSVNNRSFDFVIGGTQGEFLPTITPKLFIPMYGSYYAMKYGEWYAGGGFYSQDPEGEEWAGPLPGTPLYRAMEAYDVFLSTPDEEDQKTAFKEVLKIASENLWTINVTLSPPSLAVVRNEMRNVPDRLVYAWKLQSPGNASPETFYLEDPVDSAGAEEQIQSNLRRAVGITSAEIGEDAGLWGLVLRSLIILSALGMLLLLIVRHPFVGHRIFVMIPTLIVVSILCFIIIQAPPGDYITSLIAELEQSGESIDETRIEEIRDMFHLDEPMYMQYLHWMGVPWFWTFESDDKGLLQGSLGRSMETFQSVNSVLSDRLLLTVIISLLTILFTWIIALPFGILSAVRQYSSTDYIITFIGFIGLSIPNFLFALLLMFFSTRYLGIEISGLFSPEYAAQPEWTMGKVFDMLKHIWVPVLVTGTAGTAGLIRIMRGNLLDELRKPYVVTARAKGLHPVKLIIKYPVRLALNPFISGIAQIFPQLISGGAIVAMILSLPTIGPKLISALMSEDTYLAGSIIMIMSLLGIVGTLVSDILLLLLDPRIRMEKKN